MLTLRGDPSHGTGIAIYHGYRVQPNVNSSQGKANPKNENLSGLGRAMKDKWSILYVDDDFDSCQLIPIWLSKSGEFDVTAVVDSYEAALIIAHKHFDLYLLDYCIPDITGIGLCNQIRSKYPEVPIVFYTALDREIDRQMAAEAGANSFLVKPEDFQILVPVIENLLHNSKPFAHA